MDRLEADRLLDFLLQANRLKAVPRSGWLLRGIADPESVAEHGLGTALLTLLLLERAGGAGEADGPLDRGRALALALLHDLPECVLTDLPAPAARHLPAGAKRAAEGSILAELTEGLPGGESLRALWRELEAAESPEARLVRDADRLEMVLQALVYERTRGNGELDEFWSLRPEDLSFPAAAELLRALRRRAGRAPRAAGPGGGSPGGDSPGGDGPGRDGPGGAGLCAAAAGPAAPGATGRILAVCLSREKGTVKTPVPRARLVRDHGLAGDAHAGPWHRQVSLLADESVERMRARLPELGRGDFAENLTTEGLDLVGLPPGTRLRAGAEAVLEITQIGKRCHRGCAIYRQVGDCVMPREGIFARVLRGGTVRPGDPLVVLAGR